MKVQWQVSRTQSIAERGYDREDIDAEIEEEIKEEKKRGLKFDIRQAAIEIVE